MTKRNKKMKVRNPGETEIHTSRIHLTCKCQHNRHPSYFFHIFKLKKIVRTSPRTKRMSHSTGLDSARLGICRDIVSMIASFIE